MAHGTFLRFHQTCDSYRRVVEVNDAGQKIGSFSLTYENIPCVMRPSPSQRKIQPYIDSVDEFQIIVPSDYHKYFTYKGRVGNVSDRYGEVVEEGPFEIFQIERKTGFNGRVAHTYITLRKVVEGV